MTVTEYLLAGFASLLTLTTVVTGFVFVYAYGRTGTSLSLYLALGNFGMACGAATLALTRWSYGIPCIPSNMVWVRLTGVILCGILTTLSSIQIARLLRRTGNLESLK